MNSKQRRTWRRSKQRYYHEIKAKWELKFQSLPKLTQQMQELNQYNQYVIDQLYKMIWVKS